MSITGIVYIFLAMPTAASLNLSLVAQTVGASMTRYVHVSNELAVPDNFFSLPFASEDHSFRLVLNDSNKKLEKCMDKIKDTDGELRVLLDCNWFLKSKNNYLEQKETAWSWCEEKVYFQFHRKTR